MKEKEKHTIPTKDADSIVELREAIERIRERTKLERLRYNNLPDDIEKLREVARQAISPVRPADKHTRVGELFLKAQRTKAGRELPDHYLVYFLLVEFLGFRDLGKFEKVSWSVPIEFNGSSYLVDYRKFGVGVFCENTESLEAEAQKIVSLIWKGVKVADPFFRWLAANAVHQSQVNVRNNSEWLFQRYEYLRDEFRREISEARVREREVERKTIGEDMEMIVRAKPPDAHTQLMSCVRRAYALTQQARWIGIAAIDAFYSWTEHVFIHLAIIQSRATTGSDVEKLIDANWPSKFKQAVDLTDKRSKGFHDRLVVLRRQIRNYMAHGSFGKQGEAFDFHSRIGAVPVMLDRRRGRFSLTGDPPFDEESAIATIEDFIAHLWSGARRPARLYIQDASLPLILTFTKDGRYEKAMRSVEDMEQFVNDLTHEMDNAANMDW